MQTKIDKIYRLDMSRVNAKFSENYDSYNIQQLKDIEMEYKRFLHMILVLGGKDLLITKEVDNYWHTHILDTQKYVEDTNEIFGKYIHHDPFFNLLTNPAGKYKLDHTVSSYYKLFNKPHNLLQLANCQANCGPSGEKNNLLIRCSNCVAPCTSE